MICVVLVVVAYSLLELRILGDVDARELSS